MISAPARRRIALLAAAAAAMAPAVARGAEVAFRIPEQPRDAALMALARQSGLSLGFAPGARCGGRAGVTGRLSVDAALARLLEGSGCEARRPDPRTIVIRPAAAPRAAAPARPEPPQPRADLAEVVVTASRTEQLLSHAPSGLTAIDGATLARAGISDVRDLSLLAAGVTVTNLGPGRDKVILRGLSDGPLTGHTQSTVGLYLGDLRLTYNAPDPDLPLADVARVEVLRGPQGSLWGAGSIGGVLHVVPNPPDTAERAASLSASVRSTAHGSASMDAQGVVNLPWAAGDGALRIVAWSEIAGGVVDDDQRGLDDMDRSRRRGARAALLWRPGDHLELDLMAVTQGINTRDAAYADPAVGRLARRSAVAQPHDNDFRAVTLGARWSAAWGRLTATLAALDHEIGTTYDAAAAPPSLHPPGQGPLALTEENEIRALIGEVRASSAGLGRLQWTAGVFTSGGDQRLATRLDTVAGTAGYAESRRDRLFEAAVFGELAYDLRPDVTLTIGGRAFLARLSARSEVSVGDPVARFAGRTRGEGMAPRVVLAYRPRDQITLYAQAAEGYRTAGFNTAGAPGQAFGVASGLQPLRRYGGDELWSYEFGARWRDPERGLAMRLAGFQADWRDIQADLLLPSGLPFTANLGDGRSRGLEAEVAWIRGGLRVAANLVAQDPELRRPAPGLPARVDSGLPGVPKLGFAASAGYERPLDSQFRLAGRVSYAYVGRSRLVFDATTAPAMGGYGDLRVSVSLAGPAATIELSIDNLLDERGDTLAYGNPFLLRRQPVATPQRPRTIGVSLSRAF